MIYELPPEVLNAAKVLPDEIATALSKMDKSILEGAEEIRLRNGLSPSLLSGGISWEILGCGKVSGASLDLVLQRASRASLHSAREQLSRGYITAKGAVRIGVCGTVSCDADTVTLRDISSLAIRIAREMNGVGAQAISSVMGQSVLIISPPGGGKTTLLRELILRSSRKGTRVCIADERGEIAAMNAGAAMFDVGDSTDALSFCPKAKAAMMLLRGMNPQIIAMDEITDKSDVGAIEEIISCGVKLYATAHAKNTDDLAKRPLYRQLMELGAFDSAIIISGVGNSRKYEVKRL